MTNPDTLWSIITLIGGILGVTIVTIRSFKAPINSIPIPALTSSTKPVNGSGVKLETDEWKKIADILHTGIADVRLDQLKRQVEAFESYDPRITRLEAQVQQLQENYRILIEAGLKRGSA